MRRCFSLGFGALLLAALALHCTPQDKGEQIVRAKQDPLVVTSTNLPPPVPAQWESFGYSGDIDGNSAVVSTPWYDPPGENTGAAWVFVRSAVGSPWVKQAQLLASDKATMDHFGNSVALSGDTLVVAAREDDDKGSGSGSVYVFERSGTIWTEKTKVTASDGVAGDKFGSVAISEDASTFVVGVGVHDGKGAVYVFVGSGSSWTEQAKLTASDGATGDLFGWPAISGDTLAIGAYNDDDNGTDSGSVYIFERSGTTWTEKAKIVPADGAAGDKFGTGVALDGDTLAVGAEGDDDKGTDSGSVYVFQRSGSSWTEQAKLTASDGGADDKLGQPELEGDTLTANGGGAIYVFVRGVDGWTERKKITEPNEGKATGYSAAGISGNTILAKALYSDVLGTADTGYAYSYDLALKKVGESCTDTSDCISHVCLAGTCCATACAAPCNTCATGSCTPVSAGTEAGSCSGTSACDGAGSCKLKNGESCSAGAECLSGLCAGDTCCATACAAPCNTCATGSCAPVSAGTEAGSCSGTSACDGAGSCKLKNGESCSAGAECLGGLCVDGYCCDGACDKTCESCALSGKEGMCSPIAAGADPDQECAGTDPACAGSCDGAGQCAFPAAGNSCGTCKACDGAGDCSQTPSDDDTCGVIDCDLLDTSCKDYEDVKLERCAALGQCKPANDPATCTSYVDLPCGTPDAGVDAQPETGPAPAEAGADMGQPKTDESGCSCAVGGQPATDLAAFGLLAGLLLCRRRRRR